MSGKRGVFDPLGNAITYIAEKNRAGATITVGDYPIIAGYISSGLREIENDIYAIGAMSLEKAAKAVNEEGEKIDEFITQCLELNKLLPGSPLTKDLIPTIETYNKRMILGYQRMILENLEKLLEDKNTIVRFSTVFDKSVIEKPIKKEK